jgi:preprotein translocase subunit SecB
MEESRFRFLNYRISKIETSISEDFGNESENLKQSINVDHEICENEPRKVKVILHISITADSEKLKFSTDVIGYFEAHEEMSDELFEKLCNINAPAVLLPYARSIVTNFTALCNIKPIILPLINLTKR